MAKQHIKNTNPFAQDDALTPIEQAAQELYGGLKMKNDDRQVAKPVSIFEIHPDMAQPRRAIPLEVRKLWDGDPNSLPKLIQAWFELVNQERSLTGTFEKTKEPLDVDAFLDFDRNEDLIHNENAGALEMAFLEVINLASSIKHDGLTNPITIAKSEQGYVLETGERRWLAYHLLNLFTGYDRWSKIPARIVDAPNVWRQASENAARQNLNAIGRARQLARLLMDFFTQTRGDQFSAYEELVESHQVDRRYYAQIANGKEFEIPKGKAELFANAMGISPTQVRQYRALLRIPDEVWKQADEYNLPEGVVRKIIGQAVNEDQLLKLLKQAVEKRVTRVTPFDDEEDIPNDLPDSPTPPHEGRGSRAKRSPEFGIFTKLARLRPDRVGGYPDEEKDVIRDQISEARRLLDHLEQLLNDNN